MRKDSLLFIDLLSNLSPESIGSRICLTGRPCESEAREVIHSPVCGRETGVTTTLTRSGVHGGDDDFSAIIREITARLRQGVRRRRREKKVDRGSSCAWEVIDSARGKCISDSKNLARRVHRVHFGLLSRVCYLRSQTRVNPQTERERGSGASKTNSLDSSVR